MKTSMDTDTILFIDVNGKALGMNYNWYTKNYSSVSKDYSTPKYIYYKGTYTENNVQYTVWIDFDRALKVYPGGMMTRIDQGLRDPLMRVELTDIPAADYYDKDGYKHQISAYDGSANRSYWVQRVDNPELKLGYTHQISSDGNNLYIIFDDDTLTMDDLKNSIISLNGLFFPYTVVAHNTILFNNVVDQLAIGNANLTNYSDEEILTEINNLRKLLTNAYEIENGERNHLKTLQASLLDKQNQLLNSLLTNAERKAIEEQIDSINVQIASSELLLIEYSATTEAYRQEYEGLYNLGMRREYLVKVNVYTWDGIIKDDVMVPVKRTGEWFSMNREIDDNCIIIYKGQIFDYELSTQDKRLFKLKNVGLANLDGFETKKVTLYHMRSSDPTMEIKRYVVKGHTNVHRNTVEFVLPVNQSLILYEGLDHEYQITDEATIVYDGTKWSPEYVVDTSNVTSVNFTRVG